MVGLSEGGSSSLISELGLNLRGENDEDIIGPCGVRFDPEAHIPPVKYG
jgi:hypothetical protein